MKFLLITLFCLGGLVFSVSASDFHKGQLHGKAPSPIVFDKDPCDTGPGPAE